MLLSMTGYGRATQTVNGKTFTVEIRSLNSKQNDLRMRANQQLHKYEMELRRLVLDGAKRGKLDINVEITDETGGSAVKVNAPLLSRLYREVVAQTGQLGLAAGHADGLYAALLRIPGIVEGGSDRLSDADWESLKSTTEACLLHLDEYRLQEGDVLAADLANSCQIIMDLLGEVGKYEEDRVQSVRDRMAKHLQDFLGRSNVDKNRYEQEVLFYLEKMDINEEKVRLRQNCEYFLEILGNEDAVKGRKLNFISQEIGREVNTLGAKAYAPEIQKLVVNMKEHLEQIKEQLANVA
ncbi:YicC/YloC family endoribonuclease [Neolewinella lacunae]|uniref:YicC family protein n=1 Tax=Neolewinella lacunae TaxID=1517758 RepID=A0A923PRQ2_9BACT|nr:YicC/YloC family endoribonuclease [Neolewinella lacunae]MBC6995527.1 YicC family protein [Neolewinella lacunae]MDN3635115.1 YicC/YloC family endoribonuclease [Neolewinella lacunae]